jgi:phosphohistidine phosphatase
MGKRVYIVRHGTAVEVGEEGVTGDVDRHLSGPGRVKTEEVARGLRALGGVPDRLVTSPLVRARQTAEILAAVLAPGINVDVVDQLCPGSRTLAIVAWLQKHSGDSVMLVGHMPDLVVLGSCLLTGHSEVNMVFKKAAAMHISFDNEIEAGEGCLEWLLQPRILRALA